MTHKKSPLGFFVDPFALLWRHRSLLVATTWNDVRARYVGSALGFAWMVCYPFLFLGVYALVYSLIFKVRFGLADDVTAGGMLLIFSGLIPFLGFAEALGAGVPSVTTNVGLVKNTLFPIELIPVKTVLASQCTQVVGLGLLVIALAVTGSLTVWVLVLPLVWVLQLLFTIGLIWILSSTNVLLRDLQQMVSVLTLLLMIVSPIVYQPEMVPPNLRVFMGLNPLYHIIGAYRECLIHGRFPAAGILTTLAIMALFTFPAGLWYFRRMKSAFLDNV